MPTLLIGLLSVVCAQAGAQGIKTDALMLSASAENPRNSEGDFIRLKDGRILFVYTHYTGGSDDESTAHLAGRYSADGGKTWTTEDVTILANEGKQNIMSVSLLRLQDGRIGLFYLRKNGPDDCHPLLRTSEDEAQSWSEPVACIPDPGYYVVNNDRVVQLRSGRLVVPAANHTYYSSGFAGRGAAVCYLSDDAGKTWRRSRTVSEAPEASKTGLQEPLVVELKGGRLMMLSRTDQGCQMRSWSDDGGETWTAPETTELESPVSPASCERVPSTGDLLLVWNDHRNVPEALKGKRTPLSVALSHDEGATWGPAQVIEDDPNGWYCYTAIEFVEGQALLGYCAGDRTTHNGLERTKVVLLDLSALK